MVLMKNSASEGGDCCNAYMGWVQNKGHGGKN